MEVLNVSLLKKSLDRNPNPFDFNLYLSIQNKKLVVDGNPFASSGEFLEKLLSYFESIECYDGCADVLNRLKDIH